MENDEALQNLLRNIGMNDLEATIYIWLLKNKRSTGYKIAVQIGKPVANTYKALNSLEKKGAVICDNSSSKAFFDTIPIGEFLNKIEKQFRNQRNKIIKEVNKLELINDSSGIYELKSKELVFEKANSIINTAEHTILIDGFPAPLNKVKEYLEKRNRNDISIYVKSYTEETIKNVLQIKAGS